jgi:hypothetical protein
MDGSFKTSALRIGVIPCLLNENAAAFDRHAPPIER